MKEKKRQSKLLKRQRLKGGPFTYSEQDAFSGQVTLEQRSECMEPGEEFQYAELPCKVSRGIERA